MTQPPSTCRHFRYHGTEAYEEVFVIFKDEIDELQCAVYRRDTRGTYDVADDLDTSPCTVGSIGSFTSKMMSLAQARGTESVILAKHAAALFIRNLRASGQA